MLARLIRRPADYATPAIASVGSLLLIWVSRHNFTLFTVLIELFSVIVSMAIFMVAFNARNLIHVGIVKFISLAMFFVGSLQLLHVLAHETLHIFEWANHNLPAQLCMAAQMLRGVSVLAATCYVRRDIRLRWLSAVYAAVFVLILASLFGWPIFPVAWIEGSGPTPIKRWSALVAALFAGAAAIRLWRHRNDLDTRMLWGLVAFLGLAALGDLVLADHMALQDAQTVVGQLLRFGSTVLLYHAVVESSLRRPMDLIFRDLAASEDRFRTVADFTHDWETWQTPDGKLVYISPACERITGYTAQRFQQDPAWLLEIVHPDDRDALREHMWRHAVDHEPGEIDFRITTRRGHHRWIGHVCVPVYDGRDFMGIRASNRDITVRKEAERQRQELIEQLEQSIAEIHNLSGLIPICASCKKIRTDEGYWQSVEEYVQAHSDAGFTHGICPDCMAKLYPELGPEELAELKAAERSQAIGNATKPAAE